MLTISLIEFLFTDLGKIKQFSSNILRDLERLQKKVSLPLLVMPDKYHDHHHCSNDNTNSNKSEMSKNTKKDASSVASTNFTKTAVSFLFTVFQ